MQRTLLTSGALWISASVGEEDSTRLGQNDKKGKFWKSGVHAITVLNHHVCEMHDMKESLLFPFAFPGGYLIFWSSQGLDSREYSQVGSLLETYAFFWWVIIHTCERTCMNNPFFISFSKYNRTNSSSIWGGYMDTAYKSCSKIIMRLE